MTATLATAVPAAAQTGPTAARAERALNLWPAGRTFQVASVIGYRPLARTPIRLAFGEVDRANPDAGNLGGTAGCNRFFGAGRISGGRLAVGNLGATRMWCGRPRMDQERWFINLLTSRPTIRFGADRLWLRQRDVVVRFTEIHSRRR
ncbi:META domain-containing protein [Luedemannella flava]